MFVVKTGAYPLSGDLRGTTLGQAPALPARNSRGWKGQPGTNTLDYYEQSLIKAVKSLITLGYGIIFAIKN